MSMWFQFLREEKRKKKNLNKKIDCFINHFFYYQILSKHSIKEAKDNLLKFKEAKDNLTTFKTKFKTAQDEGTLSADQTKEMSMEILDLVEQVAEIATDVAEGVPAENGDVTNDETNDEPITQDGGEHGLDERINQGQKDDDEKLELKDKVAKLNTTVATMQKEAKQEKLAIEYAKHFPVAQREEKQKEFAKSNDSLPILEARLKEAKNFFKNPAVIKEAALQDNTFEITEMPGNNSGALDFGGKF